MKRLHYLSLFIVALFATSCSYNELPEELRVKPIFEDKITLNVETRAETYEGKALDQEYFVTAQDLENFVKFRRDASKRPDLSVKEVVSYGFDNSQTLFYILNYDKGWEVVSADKRTQPTLAHGDEGTFSMDTDNEAMKFWMNILADVVLDQRQISDNETLTRSETADEPQEVSDYVQFWDDIKHNNLLLPESRSGETYSYVVETEINSRIDVYGQELATLWGQSTPWNEFCPFVSDDTTECRSPAGCVAVAGAQMMYYLKNHFQIDDITAPLSVSCTGTIDSYIRTFNNFSSAAWTYMATTKNDRTLQNRYFSARFIAYIGELVGVDYGENSSGADTTDLPETVFDHYGISCVLTEDFDLSIIKQNTARKLPIVIRGKDAMLFGSGHAWIIDRYKKDVIETIKYYAIFDSPQTEEYLSTLDKSDATKRSVTTTITSESLYMNWGWSGDDNGWFATAPDDWWLEDNGGDSYRLKYYIKMIHNFSVN